MAWNSVRDRMPPEGTKCLIYIPATGLLAREIFMIASWTVQDGWWQAGNRRVDVTHWMPLPAPPSVPDPAPGRDEVR